MSVLIKHMAMPKGCIYANDKDQTEYCPLLNHDEVPFCQYIENEPEIAIGIDERPVYCPLSDVPEPCQDTVSRQAEIDAFMEILDRPNHAEFLYTDEICRVLNQMPSAQSEIIRCKDCKYSERWYRDKRRCFLWHETGIDVFEDGYCNYAEREE